MIAVLDDKRAGHDLTHGQLPCPACRSPLRPWGSARSRPVRQADGSTRQVRPLRARCRTCRHTHVLLPAACPPRSAYSTTVIGTALLGAAFGHSHRTVATDLNLPAETVRGWLRRARRGIDHLYQRAAQALVRVEPDLLTRLAPQPTPLAEALNLLLATSSATARTLHLETAEPWPLAAMICGGRLLAQTRPG
jgi:hypothetical protein